MHPLKILCICFLTLMLLGGGAAWRRRRRRRCDSTPCQWAWSPCKPSCGGGTQSAYITRQKGQCGGCSMPSGTSGTRICNTQCCPVNCAWGGWGSWGSCSVRCGGGTRSRSRGYSRSAQCGGSGCSGSTTSSERCNTQCCPVNCAWGAWGNYGRCSASCGGGSQSRSRSLTRATSCGGTCSGSKTSSRNCNSHPCPINCKWGPWGNFGGCSRSCGSGTQSRTRSVSVRAQHGGAACSGSSSSSQKCNSHPCPINCKWGSWGNFGVCSRSCGEGTQSRTRSVSVRAQHGGAACSGSSSFSQPCNVHPCPINCLWGAWTNFNDCPVTCGGGTQFRSRVVAVEAKFFGTECLGPMSSSQTCNTQCCPVNCAWGSWSEFSSCSVICGGGIQNRTRSIATPASCGGTQCQGSTSSKQICNTHPCPVDCLWGEWGSFGVCSVNCGGGTQSRIREITQVPLHGGQNCTGHAESAKSCNTQCCPVDCEWGPWGIFNPCPFTCGGGTQFRSRNVSVEAECGGADCKGEQSSSQLCNTQCCPVDCKWDTWGGYGECSATCGGGEKLRQRVVLVNTSCGGKECSGSRSDATPCNVDPCPVDCVWGSWSDWTQCNATCGGGSKVRSRIVDVEAQFDGLQCLGKTEERQRCNTQCCPVDCTWGQWADWSTCSHTCGKGSQMRGRTFDQFETCGGLSCDGNFTEERSCEDVCCPVDCAWGPWSEWGGCSKTCGTGVQDRSRSIETPNSCNGLHCTGPENDNRTCNTDCCSVDCVVSEWTEWSTCPDSCGVPHVSGRNRSVVTRAACGGRECPSLEEIKDCDLICHNGAKKTSTECLCASGWTGLCCDADLDECQQPGRDVCPPKAACVNTAGSYLCECEPGFRKNDDSACVNVNECATAVHNCHPSADCVDNDGSFLCACKSGYTGDGKICSDINECESGKAICPANSDCINTEGSYNCHCSVGFVSQDAVCTDINECKQDAAVCDPNADCLNTAGSYECHCHEGLSGDGKKCVGYDECAEFGESICHTDGICTDLFIGYQCVCKPGFTGDGYTECTDINECLQPNPPCTASLMKCLNTEGSYQCTCPKYMALRDGQCVELPPDFDFQKGGKSKKELPTSRNTNIQKVALYTVSGLAVILIIGLIVLRVYKVRRNRQSESLVNPNYDGNDGHSVDNDGFVAETINDGDL